MTRVWGWARSFGLFWWDFIVGDDWTAAAAVAAGLVGTGLFAHSGVAAWWLLPLVALGSCTFSISRGR